MAPHYGDIDIPAGKACTQCQRRWYQSSVTRLCRVCSQLNQEAVLLAYRERETRQRAEEHAAAVQAVVVRGERPRRTVVIRRVEYDVVFDGT